MLDFTQFFLTFAARKVQHFKDHFPQGSISFRVFRNASRE
jgi:hypothetical protein